MAAITANAGQIIRLFQAPMLRYTQFATQKPYTCSGVTGFTLLGCADTAAQWLTWQLTVANTNLDYTDVRYRFDWDSRRTLALSVFGGLHFGLICRRIYLFYDRTAARIQNRRRFHGRPLLSQSRIVFGKTFVDCWIHTPFFCLPNFYLITGLIKGMNLSEIKQQMRDELVTAAVTSSSYWTPIMALLFAVIPPAFRTAYISSVSFFQKMALSWFSNRNRVKQRQNAITAIDAKPTTAVAVESTTIKKGGNVAISKKNNCSVNDANATHVSSSSISTNSSNINQGLLSVQ